MKIISSNIRFSNIADGKNSWDARKDFYLSVMNSIHPDILSSQEGRENQLRELEFGLTDMNLVDQNRTWIDERMYPCIYTTSSIEVRDSGDKWLSDTPDIAGTKLTDSAFPRLLTWSRLKEREKEFIVFNMHLDHTTDDVRLSQAKVAVAEIHKINKNSLPIIVMGDFNSAPDQDVYRYFIKELGLIDPWRYHKKEEHTTYHKFLGIYPEGVRIDWILHTEEFKTKEIKLLKDNRDGRYLSDHFPIFCDISL
jgi:endonuclease/exonuclease/phosphatase family metal-dependent hydrolase